MKADYASTFVKRNSSGKTRGNLHSFSIVQPLGKKKYHGSFLIIWKHLGPKECQLTE